MSDEQIEHVPLSEIEMQQLLRKEVFPEKLDTITNSIERDGMLCPVRLFRLNGKYVPIDGLHRCLAALKMGWKTIPALIEKRKLSEPELLALGLSANSHRSDNTPLEKAEGIARIMQGTGWNGQQVADRLGYSPSTVTKLLSCLKLPEEVRLRLHRGEIGLSEAYALTRESDPDRQTELATQLAASELTLDQLLRRQNSGKPPSPQSTPPSTPLNRAVALTGQGESVSVSGNNLDFDRFIELLEATLSRARKARQQGLTLQTHLKVLREEAKAQSSSATKGD